MFDVDRPERDTKIAARALRLTRRRAVVKRSEHGWRGIGAVTAGNAVGGRRFGQWSA
ncbi:hypothetical protein ACFYSW_29515 [Rhodococcus aetherivorans]|uniref:hypothetical protein n=1 Tax=Rhodococcus aetherivorans TaxID=191292 RepID=UPI00367F4A19